MKTRQLILCACVALAFGLASCEKGDKETKEYLVTFEEVALGEGGFWDGSDLSGTAKEEEDPYNPGGTVKNYYGEIVSGVAKCQNVFTPSPWGGSWKGFACSSLTDTETPGYGNQYSVSAAEGANHSKQFALAFSDGATLACPANEHGNFTAASVYLANSTYAYLSMKDGDDYTKKFGEGDWFKVTLKGYLGENETGSVDYYLADFRNGKSFLSNTWEKVDISALGEVDKIIFSFDSTDKGEYGMNTPAYVCIDNLLFTQEIEK